MAEPFFHIYDQHAQEISVLWMLWRNACSQPQHTSDTLRQQETRIFNHVAGLMVKTDLAWDLCEQQLEFEDPAEAFTAAQVAFRSYKTERVKHVIDYAIAHEPAQEGVVSAIEWLPNDIAHPWIKKLLESKDLNHKALALKICIARRENPGQYLNAFLEREDCLAHVGMRELILKSIGVFKRQELLETLGPSIDKGFWFYFALFLNGKNRSLETLSAWLKSAQSEPTPLGQSIALNIALRSLTITQARVLISDLAKDPESKRQVVMATAILGDPHAIPWLLTVMQEPNLARVAGAAFSCITGVTIADSPLEAQSPYGQDQILEQEATENNPELSEDEFLVWPNQKALAELWQQRLQATLQAGNRYFLGRPLTEAGLIQALAEGTQPQRHWAAYELAVQYPNYPLNDITHRQTPRT